ncbi:MED7 protein-domain-containing protein [Dendryphion nanum]|uniref:Mediator of RNA polymerase II transcription subunit 7 n=1 Tax=Dendryphion nanum TaxID=256645 RepID=A0A9P9ILV1_9PLEO|nr:MED7 protein-domain-containing protein [Dendryphion nanum]
MADDTDKNPPEEPTHRAPWPSPPPYYTFFTAENQERLKEFKNDTSVEKDTSSIGDTSPILTPSRLQALPEELRYLIPPEPPADDEQVRVLSHFAKGSAINNFVQDMGYVSEQFLGQPYLFDWQYEQLYPSAPEVGSGEDTTTTPEWTRERKQYLFRFLRSALLSFVELLGVVVQDPTSDAREQKLKHILNAFANMHALVNEYRPHQARMTLIRMMEQQLEQKKKEIDDVRRMKEKVDKTLAEFAKSAPEKTTSAAPEENPTLAREERRKENQRHMWQAMDEILGH